MFIIYYYYSLKKPPLLKKTGWAILLLTSHCNMRNKKLLTLLTIMCQNAISMIYSLLEYKSQLDSSFSIQGVSGFDTPAFFVNLG